MDSQDAVNGVGRGVAELTLVEAGVKAVGRGTHAAVSSVLGLLCRLVPHDPVDAGDAGDAFLIADTLRQEPVPDLPSKHRGIFLLIFGNGVNNWRCGHFGLAATNHPCLEVASFVISWEDLGDTSMGDSELAADVAGPHSLMSELHNSWSDNIGQGAAIDKNPSELVNSSVT